MDRKLLAGGAAMLIIAAGLGYAWLPRSTSESGPEAAMSGDQKSLSSKQATRLAIRLEPAMPADALPLGMVPAQVSLPPQARVAVAAPFPGVAIRVLVLEGQQVVRGQPLAVVRAAQPMQFGAELARAKADLEFEREKAERLSMLAREGVVAGVRADEARAALARTRATVDENRRLLSLAGASGDGTATLRAPISGRVARVQVETGGSVGGDAAPFVIENIAQLTLDLQLPERLAGKVRPGMAVSVPLPGTSNTVAGKILSVSPSLDPVTRSISAKASLSSAAGLVPGQGISVLISDPAGMSSPGVSVPAAAATRLGKHDYVFVREGRGDAARFVGRKVMVIAEAGDRVIVTGALKPGEQVAVTAVAELKSVLGGE